MNELPIVPLTEAQTRAGLWAIRRVLDVARHAATDPDTPSDAEELAEVLACVEDLPAQMLRPVGFPDRFRGTLEDLAQRNTAFAPVLDEFDRLTNRHRKRVKAFSLEDDPWRDCGCGD
jgi:hypothetical protein